MSQAATQRAAEQAQKARRGEGKDSDNSSNNDKK